MNRRSFLKTTGTGALGVAVTGCLRRRAPVTAPRRPALLVPVDVSPGRVIRTTVGLRPHREAGFRLESTRLDEKTVIHNYGHGGAGMSLSWGTAAMAAELALAHESRRAAVIGCGVAGLTTARQLQRRGFDVTIYAAQLPPYTTSNMSWASFTPTSGLYSASARTPEWDAQFRKSVEIAYRELQLLVGVRYGISWIDEYSPTNNAGQQTLGSRASGAGGGRGGQAGDALLPASVEVGRETLLEGHHPFATRFARRQPTLKFEPSIYLDALMRDVIDFGGRIAVRSFDTPRDLMLLEERLIINCTGYGSKKLFGDDSLIPVKGQLVVLVPQPEVNYMTGGMLPRSDGIVLGHVMERGVESLDVNEEERTRVIESAMRLFNSMRAPASAPAAQTSTVPAEIPPVEAFFGKES
jgi:glycine/D-amino acid oxidase-like deaminating enzyme